MQPKSIELPIVAGALVPWMLRLPSSRRRMRAPSGLPRPALHHARGRELAFILTLCEGDHWVAHWGLPDHSTPEYRQPDPRLQVRASGGFLCGPYKSQDEAYAAAKCRIDGNLKGDTTTTGT
jgi:hypothetical protein